MFRRFTCLLLIACSSVAFAQDEPSSDAKLVVDFQRDIVPIFKAKCLRCHGEKDAKNDFRVDDADALLGYVTPGDVEGSSLWTDYLRTDDEDMLMPPKDSAALNASELALVQVWISEGAKIGENVMWDESAADASPIPALVVDAPATKPTTLMGRLWAFQGYLHPATVHFPIALLLVGGVFVVIGIRYPALGDNVAVVCLILGALSAIAATAMGWSFATTEGYGRWDKVDFDSEIFWHRWSAVIVTFCSIVASLFAIAWLRTGSSRFGAVWKVGLVVIAAMVGLVGHQGGELTYGKTFYQEAFEILLGTEPAAASPMEALQSDEQSDAPESSV